MWCERVRSMTVEVVSQVGGLLMAFILRIAELVHTSGVLRLFGL